MKKWSLLLGVLMLLFLALPAYANIIDSTYGAGAGSFELGTFVNNSDIYNFMYLPKGSKTITGWTVGGPGDGVDWLMTPNWGADTGIHSLDLQGSVIGSVLGQNYSSIATVIPTFAGQVYKLTFSAAANADPIYSANAGIVSAGSLVNQPFTAEFSNDFATQTFKSFAFLFTATGPTTTIEFTATLPGAIYGPVIDSVSVVPTAPAPVPPTVWFLAAGLGCMALYRQRKLTAKN
jgi:hypothetical protein